jgi:glycine/serine hydroxymethyltransferase
MGKVEMLEIADIISTVIHNASEPETIQEHARRVKVLCDRFPVYR